MLLIYFHKLLVMGRRTIMKVKRKCSSSQTDASFNKRPTTSSVFAPWYVTAFLFHLPPFPQFHTHTGGWGGSASSPLSPPT